MPISPARSSAISMRTGARGAGQSSAVKLARLALQFGRGTWIVAVRFGSLDQAQKNLAFQRWAQQVLAILNIEVHATTAVPRDFAGLVVCNHLSWLDVLVLQSLMPGAFVAKAEVRRWPLVGYLAHACATIFVDRSSARAAQGMVADTAAAIARGHAVVVFPEGTSSDGRHLGTFHPNIFESAIRAQSQVQTVALKYIDPSSGAVASEAHFTGDMTLATSLKRVTGISGMRAVVHIGDCIDTVGHSRKSLALQAHASIRSHLLGAAHAHP